MPYCTIEEAWGENIYKVSKINNEDDNLHKEDVLYTNSIDNSSKKRSRRKKKSSSIKYNKSDVDSYIDNLKKENEELRHTILQLKDNIDQINSGSFESINSIHNIKMKVIDIVLYILTGIFVIFIIDIILKFNNNTRFSTDNIF